MIQSENYMMDKSKTMKTKTLIFIMLSISLSACSQNKDPMATEIITSDLDNFWVAFEKAGAEIDPHALEEYYLKLGSKGVKGFMRGRIKNSEHLAKVIRYNRSYYSSIKPSVDSIHAMKDEIRASLVKLKDLYPEAIFPPVYFVIGTLNSGGTSTRNGLIIGAEMYGLSNETPKESLNDWLKTVLKPVSEVPHIVVHELVHFQQKYNGRTLLSASIKEGAADFIGELVTGKHINKHIHDYANPNEEALWKEFKDRMHKKDFSGWLYSSSGDRPNDLGYWMGYKIVEAYYNKSLDKRKAIKDILTIKDFDKFLTESGYADKFK
jgi:hypothetical protein